MTDIIELESDPGLDELQRLVGGYIQIVPNFEQHKGRACDVLANEDGWGRLPLNRAATEAWREELTRQVGPDGWDRGMAMLFGPVVILYGGMRREL